MNFFARLLLILTLTCNLGLHVTDAAHDVGDAGVALVADVPASADAEDHASEGGCELGGARFPCRPVVGVKRAPQVGGAPLPLASAIIPELPPPIFRDPA